jgi:hypothetical protein
MMPAASGPPVRWSVVRHDDYIDVLANSLTRCIDRHNRWSSLEAEELSRLHPVRGVRVPPRIAGTPIEQRRFLRQTVYNRLPLFVRPFLLWFFDYIVRLGFLDGAPGLIFHTLQRFWFRFLIDAKIYEARRARRHRAGPGG